MIDLRSDTVTRPSHSMLTAMSRAVVGDDVLGDDYAVIDLQDYAAELFRKEAALFFPSGTMSNQAALLAHTQRGDEIFLHERSHIIMHEQGGLALLAGLQARCFASRDGTLPVEDMEEFFHDGSDPHHARTRLVSLENTHNQCGGVVLPMQQVRHVRELCDRHELILHLDGARITNAAVASNLPLWEIVEPYDSLSTCLSKGLGAPIGSLLLGPQDFISRARRARKLLGGGMRQAGFMAAAGLFALRQNIQRLSDDHRRCQWLAERLALLRGLAIDLNSVQTNMIYVNSRELGVSARTLVNLLWNHGVACMEEGPFTVRFVTHLDVDDGAVKEAAGIIEEVATQVAGVPETS